MAGNTESWADCMLWRVVKCPNRARATMSGHRSAAQNGQKSAPTNRTSGFPDDTSGGWWVRTVGTTSGKRRRDADRIEHRAGTLLSAATTAPEVRDPVHHPRRRRRPGQGVDDQARSPR